MIETYTFSPYFMLIFAYERPGAPLTRVLVFKQLKYLPKIKTACLSLDNAKQLIVGAPGFEPGTSCTPCKHAKPDCATPR